MQQASFTPPEFWNFKPFFTLQPVKATQTKQLESWKDLILRYHAEIGNQMMNPSDFRYFENTSIDRKASTELVNKIIAYLIECGNAEWDDSSQTRLRIMWRTTESLASDIYTWAKRNHFLGNIYTVYELLMGDEYTDSGFHNSDTTQFMKALNHLQRQNKCHVIEGSTVEEHGVKFL